MAEILILLIFLLMLLLASKLVTERQAREAAYRQRDAAIQELDELRPIVQEITRAGQTGFDITKEYVRIKKALAEANKRIDDAVVAENLLKEAQKISPNATVEAAVKKMVELAEAGRHTLEQASLLSPGAEANEALNRFVEAAKIGTAIRSAGGDAKALLASAASCKAELQTCKGQTAYLNKRLGGDLPPCWVNSQGLTQYIYDVHLREDGIYLVDDKVAGREAEQAALPLGGLKFGEALQSDPFRQAGAAIKAWSDDHGCRFFVRIYDQTSPGSKERYKDLKRGVEDVFYKWDMQ